MCLYDHAVLLNTGGVIWGGEFEMIMMHFFALLPSLVTIEKVPLVYVLLYIVCDSFHGEG
jgi:hypothetical protein